MKKKIVLVFILIIIYWVFSIVSNNISVKDVPLKKFEPFSNNNVLKKKDVRFKIENDLPKIEAASAFYPFSANLVQAIYDENNFKEDDVKMVSTNNAFMDIINGKTDFIVATMPSDEQAKMIQDSGVELEYVHLFKEPLAIIVNKKVRIDSLDIDEVRLFYYSKELLWNDYEPVNIMRRGKNIIHTYQLEKNNGSQTCFESIVKNNKLGKNHYEIKLMPDIIDKIGKDKNGICYAFYSYYSKMHSNFNTKILSVNGKNVTSSDYPLLFDVYLIYRTNNKKDNMNKIINWLNSEEGQRTIKLIK